MQCSRNELTAVLAKAASGTGLPVGVAQDAARAAVWLEEHGEEGVSSLLAALSLEDQHQSALVRGVAAVDLAIAEPGRSIAVPELDLPILVAGYAGSAAVDGATVMVTFAADVSATVGPDRLALTGRVPPRSDVTIEAILPPSVPSLSPPLTVARPYRGAIDVSDTHWEAASALAAQTYVPATEASRLKGAGAGLTDND